MADNYLEKRYDEVFGKKTLVKKVGRPLDSLFLENRSTRGYESDFIVREEVLRKIIGVNTKIASALNQQVLRFKIVLSDKAPLLLQHVKMGGLLPELHLPLKGTEPNAFIIVCSTIKENRNVDIDLGISLQSMLLKAVEIGLNGLIIGSFNREKISEAFDLQFSPLAILAIGKSKEKIRLKEISETDNHKYFRQEDNTHVVPKVKVEDLIM